MPSPPPPPPPSHTSLLDMGRRPSSINHSFVRSCVSIFVSISLCLSLSVFVLSCLVLSCLLSLSLSLSLSRARARVHMATTVMSAMVSHHCPLCASMRHKHVCPMDVWNVPRLDKHPRRERVWLSSKGLAFESLQEPRENILLQQPSVLTYVCFCSTPLLLQ